MKAYFFDSYALFETVFGNENYAQHLREAGIITMRWNLLELHYHLLVRRNRKEADIAYKVFADATVDPTHDDIKEASIFRSQNTKLKLSFIDCVGYVMAKRRGVKFLTGDKAFKEMENVEFVI